MALPGVKTVLKDRFYTLSRTDAPAGTRVAAIARRNNSPNEDGAKASYDPYTPRNELDVINAFGNGSELHRAYLELVSGGAARIDLIAVDADVTDADLVTDDQLDKTFGAVEQAQSDIVVCWGRGGHPDDFSATDDWEQASPSEYDATPIDTNDVGFAADDANVVSKVSARCADITERSNPVFAVMGVNPWMGATTDSNGAILAGDVSSHISSIVSGLPARDTVSNGRYVSVVATELRPVGYPQEFGFANGAATYGGFVSALDAENAPTGRRLFNVSGLRYAPTRPQRESLVDAGVVPVELDFSRAARITDGLTYAEPTSDYARLSTLRIIFDTIQLVRQVCQGYIGMPATLEHRSSMETAISSRLRGMTVTGVLLDSDFTVTYVPRENKAIIDLVVRPAFEIRNIEISIAVDL